MEFTNIIPCMKKLNNYLINSDSNKFQCGGYYFVITYII